MMPEEHTKKQKKKKYIICRIMEKAHQKAHKERAARFQFHAQRFYSCMKKGNISIEKYDHLNEALIRKGADKL